MHLCGDVLVVLIVHQVFLVHGVEELHDGARPGADLSALLDLHGQHRVGDDLLRHGVGHCRGRHRLRLRGRRLRRAAELLHADDVLPADEAVERYDCQVHIVGVVVLENPVTLDLARVQVADQAEHPQSPELAQQVTAHLLRHYVRQVENGELGRRALPLLPGRLLAHQLGHRDLVQVELRRGVAVVGHDVVVGPLDGDLIALVIDSRQLHAN
mmetsp:Transcript_75193/g.195994  ORF Transcript_75193/g.195994 Transcript_75193/m.195994 type:complete len:213 (-) Transcript_75193:1118-1756(-)